MKFTQEDVTTFITLLVEKCDITSTADRSFQFTCKGIEGVLDFSRTGVVYVRFEKAGLVPFPCSTELLQKILQKVDEFKSIELSKYYNLLTGNES